MVYSYQAPDFETKSDNGETLVLEHRTAFQGRIDSPRLYTLKKCGPCSSRPASAP
jgi:hypothetical protein